jgi:murein L,D-transpeptidase YcbB/YkuD
MRTLAPLLAVVTALLTAGLSVLTSAQSETANETAIRTALTATAHVESQTSDEELWREDLLEVYKSRSFAPLWFTGVHPTRQTLAVLSELRRAEERGLRSSDYDLGRLVREMPSTSEAVGRLRRA